MRTMIDGETKKTQPGQRVIRVTAPLERDCGNRDPGAALGGVALGITYLVASGFGKALSFEHIVPMLVPET